MCHQGYYHPLKQGTTLKVAQKRTPIRDGAWLLVQWSILSGCYEPKRAISGDWGYKRAREALKHSPKLNTRQKHNWNIFLWCCLFVHPFHLKFATLYLCSTIKMHSVPAPCLLAPNHTVFFPDCIIAICLRLLCCILFSQGDSVWKIHPTSAGELRQVWTWKEWERGGLLRNH